MAYLRLLAVELKLSTSHLCEKIQSIWGLPNGGTIGTVVNLALGAVSQLFKGLDNGHTK